MKTLFTIVSDNHAADGLQAEHGFALWVEHGDTRLLFDTGEGGAFWHNVGEMGIDIANATAVALSHGHNDHSGNLGDVLEKAPRATLYCHPECNCTRYSIRDSATAIGMPVGSAVTMAAMRLDKRRAVLRPKAIAAGLWLSGPIPRQTTFEDVGGPYFMDREGCHPDPVIDDMALWVETGAGLVVCVGCAHAGLINTLHHAAAASGREIVMVIGGAHLLHASDVRLRQTAAALTALKIPKLVLCHCTGETALTFLAGQLGGSVIRGCAGMKIEP